MYLSQDRLITYLILYHPLRQEDVVACNVVEIYRSFGGAFLQLPELWEYSNNLKNRCIYRSKYLQIFTG
jgi:hypothetical protein